MVTEVGEDRQSFPESKGLEEGEEIQSTLFLGARRTPRRALGCQRCRVPTPGVEESGFVRSGPLNSVPQFLHLGEGMALRKYLAYPRGLLNVYRLIPEKGGDMKSIWGEVLNCPSPSPGPKQEKWAVPAAGRMHSDVKQGFLELRSTGS